MFFAKLREHAIIAYATKTIESGSIPSRDKTKIKKMIITAFLRDVQFSEREVLT